MLAWLRGKTELTRTGHELYERIVAQARQPELYTGCGVPDTMNGRLELILLHVVLVLERLKREREPGPRLGQRLLECLVSDLDDALRQIGIGDDGVAGRMPKLAGAIAERAGGYREDWDQDAADLQGGEEVGRKSRLEMALLAHVYRVETSSDSGSFDRHAFRLAHYVRDCRVALDAQESGMLLSGRVRFPAVASSVSE